MTNARSITFEGKTYKLSEGQTALDAMLRGGANIVFSCRRGTCRSCMLEAVSGDPGEASQARLPQELRDLGFFLPCVASHPENVEAVLPDLSKWVTPATLISRTELADGVYKIQLEPERNIEWRAGQFISIRNPNGDVRSYSLASIEEDYFVEFHVRHYPDGKISDWLINDLNIGDTVEFNGPTGTCYYSRDVEDKPLVLVGTGTGGGMLLGIARDALTKGHSTPIQFYHGAGAENGLYLRDELAALSSKYPNFSATSVASQEAGKQRALNVMLADNSELAQAAVFICGNPNMVESARIGAVRNGASIDNIFADPFESDEPYQPRDKTKISNFEPDLEMWHALDDGKMVTEILTEFYNLVFEDTRLAPFFHKVTKQRLIEKQYSFTRDLLQGSRDYFGEVPFNSHHWMVVSDELFDYREHLFFDVVANYNLPEKFIRRWAALNELFRREIVKTQIRGQIMDGVEHFREKFIDEVIEVETLCDGCFNEMKVGDMGRLHARTGELFCKSCQGE